MPIATKLQAAAATWAVSCERARVGARAMREEDPCALGADLVKIVVFAPARLGPGLRELAVPRG
jgi:hypothetical protein